MQAGLGGTEACEVAMGPKQPLHKVLLPQGLERGLPTAELGHGRSLPQPLTHSAPQAGGHPCASEHLGSGQWKADLGTWEHASFDLCFALVFVFLINMQHFLFLFVFSRFIYSFF